MTTTLDERNLYHARGEFAGLQEAEWVLPWYAWRAKRRIRGRQRTVLADIRMYDKAVHE